MKNIHIIIIKERKFYDGIEERLSDNITHTQFSQCLNKNDFIK